MVALASFLGLLVVFALLAVICERYFVPSLDVMAARLRLTHDVAGATLMAIGSSAPELFTALIALTKVGAEEVGAGTIVGSAIFNILVIVGASAAVGTAVLRWRPVLRDLGAYFIAILILLATFSDGQITLGESLSYLLAYALYIGVLVLWPRWFPHADEPVTADEGSAWQQLLGPADRLIGWSFPALGRRGERYGVIFTVAILWIIALSWVLVELGVTFAHAVGLPEVVIALTILAGGTSVPDLLSSLIVARQGRGDMAVSNAVGSNTFDILVGLGLPWVLYIGYTGGAAEVGTENLTASILLLFFTVVALLFLLLVQRFRIGPKAGYVLLVLYAGYLVYALLLAL